MPKAKRSAARPSSKARKPSRRLSFVALPLPTKSIAEDKLLSLDAKADGSDWSRVGVRSGKYSPSFMMATNGGAAFEDILRVARPAVEAAARNRDAPRDSAVGLQSADADRALVEVTDTSRIPARSIGLLKIHPEHGDIRYGTAWLIGPRVLATAAHNLIHPEAGRAIKLEVGLAYDGKTARGGWHRIVDNRFSEAWQTTPAPENPHDYAVLKIDDPQIGNQLGWFGIADYDDAKFNNLALNLFGYPMDDRRFHMYGGKGRVVKVERNRIFHDCESFGGMSGGPLIARFGEQRIAVGVHVSANLNSAAAVRITDEAFELFEKYKGW